MQVPGDWQHQAGGHRGQQAQGGHPGGGEQDRGVQEGEPGHLLLGDQGEVSQGETQLWSEILSYSSFCPGWSLQQGDSSQCVLHLQGVTRRRTWPGV